MRNSWKCVDSLMSFPHGVKISLVRLFINQAPLSSLSLLVYLFKVATSNVEVTQKSRRIPLLLAFIIFYRSKSFEETNTRITAVKISTKCNGNMKDRRKNCNTFDSKDYIQRTLLCEFVRPIRRLVFLQLLQLFLLRNIRRMLKFRHSHELIASKQNGYRWPHKRNGTDNAEGCPSNSFFPLHSDSLHKTLEPDVATIRSPEGIHSIP